MKTFFKPKVVLRPFKLISFRTYHQKIIPSKSYKHQQVGLNSKKNRSYLELEIELKFYLYCLRVKTIDSDSKLNLLNFSEMLKMVKLKGRYLGCCSILTDLLKGMNQVKKSLKYRCKIQVPHILALFQTMKQHMSVVELNLHSKLIYDLRLC